MNSLAIVMPALNEATNIEGVICKLRATVPSVTIWVIDDSSEDDTLVVAHKTGATVLSLAARLGPWGASQAGIRHAHQLGFEYVLTMDADGQHLPESIPTLVSAMQRSKADIVIGSATSRGSRLRKVAWKLMRGVSGLHFSDLTSGLRLYNSKAMSFVADERASYLQYPDIGVLALAMRNNLKVVETEVEMADRQQGVSRIFSSWLAVLLYMINTLLLGASKRSRYKSKANSK